MRKVKYLIIGSGVSGLAFANFINSDDYLILEKESEAGGFCRTIYKNGFVWDYAGHFFHFANEKLKKFFNEKIKGEDLVHKNKQTNIYYEGDYVEYPFQKNIHQLPKEEFIDCLYDLFNKTEKETYSDFEDMLYGKFGKGITEKFLKPYNEKLYACSLNNLDVDAMGRFFPYADTNEIIRNMRESNNSSYNDEFLYPKNGAITFVKALLSDLSEEKIFYNQEVIKVDKIKKIASTKNEDIEYSYLINTSPLDRFIKLIDLEEFKRLKEKLTYNKVLVFNLGFDKKSTIRDTHWTYIPDKNINFYRIGFYDNILDGNKLSMYVEIGYPSDANINIDEQLELSLENLKKMKVITDHKLEAYSSIVMDPAYVHVSSEVNNIKMEKKAELAKDSIYTIGRYGDWKYCSIEDSIIDAIELCGKLKEK